MAGDPKQMLGDAIRARREEHGLTLERLSLKLKDEGQLVKGHSKQHLSAIERAVTWPSLPLARALDQVLGTEGEIVGLLRDAKVPISPETTGTQIWVTAHLFYPLLIDRVPQPDIAPPLSPLTFVPRLGPLPPMEENRTLHIFPFGVVVLHERFDINAQHLGEIATWREGQLLRSDNAVIDHLWDLKHSAQAEDDEPYCFTAFVINELPWTKEHQLIRATELLSNPSVLIPGIRDPDPRRFADSLVNSTGSVSDVLGFSQTNSHFGAASWAAVALHPMSNSLNSYEITVTGALIDLEIQLQAFWCYASNVGKRGNECIRLHYDAMFLRQTLAKLQCPSPKEHTAVRLLREALVSTSRISTVVDSAVVAASHGKE